MASHGYEDCGIEIMQLSCGTQWAKHSCSIMVIRHSLEEILPLSRTRTSNQNQAISLVNQLLTVMYPFVQTIPPTMVMPSFAETECDTPCISLAL